MPRPYFYVNVHQTIWVGLAVFCVIAYIADLKGVRTDVNKLVSGGGAR